MSHIDEIRKNRKPTAPVEDNREGYIWLNMLIKFNTLTGKSEIVRSFTKAAKDSTIKSILKPKKPVKPTIDIKKPTKSSTGLFD